MNTSTLLTRRAGVVGKILSQPQYEETKLLEKEGLGGRSPFVFTPIECPTSHEDPATPSFTSSIAQGGFVLDRVTYPYGERGALPFSNAFSRKHFHSYTAMNPESVHRLEKRNGITFPLSDLKGDGLTVLSHQGLGQKFRDGDMTKGEKVCASLSERARTEYLNPSTFLPLCYYKIFARTTVSAPTDWASGNYSENQSF